MITILINGEEARLNEGITVSQLLVEKKVKMPEMVSVELNGAVLDRAAFDATGLAEGDRVEFLYFMGGGQGDFPAGGRL